MAHVLTEQMTAELARDLYRMRRLIEGGAARTAPVAALAGSPRVDELMRRALAELLSYLSDAERQLLAAYDAAAAGQPR